MLLKINFFHKGRLISCYMEHGLLFSKAGKNFVGLLIIPIFIRFSCRGGAGEEICAKTKQKKKALLHNHEVS